MKSSGCLVIFCCFSGILLGICQNVQDEGYSITGSSEFGMLHQTFAWTCEVIRDPPPVITSVKFIRNDDTVIFLAMRNGTCEFFPLNTNHKYTYECKSETIFRLTIPAERMTEDEQGSRWICEYPGNGAIKSRSITLNIAVDVHNVSLSPSGNQLILRENRTKEVLCIVNKNAFPAPTITWYIGSTNITSTAGENTTYISVRGKRDDNKKSLECRATNNNKQPKKAITTLNVQFPPLVSNLTQQDIIEGRNLSVTCLSIPGNPNNTSFSWTGVNNFKNDGKILNLENINRNSSGNYKCTAENTYSDGTKGNDSQTMVVNVLYPPLVASLESRRIIEGLNLSVTCSVMPGNPNVTRVSWTVEKSENQFNGKTLQISKIQRNSSGTYRCTAKNSYGSAGEGTSSQDMHVDVLFPPLVSNLRPLKIIEGMDLSVICNATPGNPNSTTFFWTRVNKLEFRQNGTTLVLNSIQRNSSGIYNCTAENTYYGERKGNHSQSMEVDVLYKPAIERKPTTIVNESERIELTREIESNPSSNISWYSGSTSLKNETNVKTATFIKEKALCTDTNNFTLVASNGVQESDTAIVELIVNCKPVANDKNITLGVTDTSGIAFSATVLAYPPPHFILEYENGTQNHQMLVSTTRMKVNSFTVHYNQTIVKQSDYGTYHLQVSNPFGNTTIYVNVIPQRRPDSPQKSEVNCDVISAQVQWLSSFDGGDNQQFIVLAYIGDEEASRSEPVFDVGENIIHKTSIHLLQPSTDYFFYVFAKNKHGNTSSEVMSCKTLAEDVPGNLPIIAGSAAAGGITLAVVVIVTIVFLRRFKRQERRVGKSKRFSNDECTNEDTDDGLKDNILYVSAGPRNDNESERAVYAAVTKKPLEDSANVYADVKNDGKKPKTEAAIYSDVKPKKGLFKKDGKQKQKNGRKQKGKQAAADVYENSEDIAMTSNADNVYSNTNYNSKIDEEQRGYKNKDGLLYVDVQFDAKKGRENPVIHGEDEKTDYATVEFPMPSLSQEDACAEK